MSYNLKYYCKDYENIENYDKALKDNFNGWEVHHRLETHNSDGERRLVDITAAELEALGMYWRRPAKELIFLTRAEHNRLHKKGKQGYWKGKTGPNKGKQFSAEARIHMSEAMKGKYTGENHPMYGKKHSDEARRKMSESHKGKHIGNTATKGKRWFNNGKINIRAKERPDGFTPGRLRK